MFIESVSRSQPQNSALFSPENKETSNFFHNFSLESIREARRRALQARKPSPKLAGTITRPETSSGDTKELKIDNKTHPQTDQNPVYEADQKRLHEQFTVIKLVGEGHFGKVYKVKATDNGVVRAAKVVKTKSSSSLPRCITSS